MNQDDNQQEPLGPIEYSSSVTESTGDHQYSDTLGVVDVMPIEQTALSIIGLILALPFPILIIVLWAMMSVVKEQSQVFSGVTLNVVGLYLFQFFIVPVLSITSIVIGFIVTNRSKRVARKIGYASFAVTGIGFVILGLFLHAS